MPFTDLLRMAVLLTAGEATALAMIALLGAWRENDVLLVGVAGGWWLVATVIGLVAGSPGRADRGVRKTVSEARMSASLPPEPPARIALLRLWPIAATAVLAGVLGIFLPPVATVGAGFAILVALAWRGHEAAVDAIEKRDGARFYVLSGSAFKPLRLMRAPGLSSDRSARP